MIDLFAPTHIINFDETLVVHRIGQVIYTDGKPVQRKIEPYSMVCNVQPVDGRDLLMVPEHDRFKEQYWIYSEQNQEVPVVNDLVVRHQINFQVQSVENWGSYSRMRVMRIDIGPYATP